MGLKINREKTRVVNLREAGASLDFLGYTFRYDRDLYGADRRYLNVFPSRKSLQKERAQLRRDDRAARMCFKPMPRLIADVNRHLQGLGQLLLVWLSPDGLPADQPLRACPTDPSPQTTQPAPYRPPAGSDATASTCTSWG